MNQIVTQAIVLRRIDYGEADRIITLLTPDQGKLRLMAKGVRRLKSKLAGGIELFSVSQITFVRGRGEIGTLISARLSEHYGAIVSHIDRVQLGYEFIKIIDKTTEDEPEEDYFRLLEHTFLALNDARVPSELIRVWFDTQLLTLDGHTPNLQTDTEGHKLKVDKLYDFDIDSMAFDPKSQGHFGATHIKFLRLMFAGNVPRSLVRVERATELCDAVASLVQTLRTHS